jgi:hypothetical protein
VSVEDVAVRARGERAGAATWRFLAERADGEAARDVLLPACLESLLDGSR